MDFFSPEDSAQKQLSDKYSKKNKNNDLEKEHGPCGRFCCREDSRGFCTGRSEWF